MGREGSQHLIRAYESIFALRQVTKRKVRRPQGLTEPILSKMPFV